MPPDPEDEQTISELCRQFADEYEPRQLKEQIRKAQRHFAELRSLAHENNGARIQVWFLSAVPRYTMYRFDDTVIFVPYKQSLGRGGVPAFVFERPGILYDYFVREFEWMTTTGTSVK